MGASRPLRNLLCGFSLLSLLLVVACTSSSSEDEVDAQPACAELCSGAQFPDAFAEVEGSTITCFCRGEGPVGPQGQAPTISQESCSAMCSGFDKQTATAFSSTSTAKNTCRCS